MSRALVCLSALAVLSAASATAQAGPWKRHRSKKLGFSMPVPRGTAFTETSWPGGWGGLAADRDGLKLLVAVKPGEKKTAAQIEALAHRLSGIADKHWTVKRTRKARGGWGWFNIARASHGKNVAHAVYGLGPRGTYLMLALTSPAGARKHRAALARWTRGVRLH